MSVFLQKIGGAPNESAVVTVSKDVVVNSRLWQNWFNQVEGAINESEYYGNPSVSLNPDFNFVSGVPTPRTQAAGDGVSVAEKWLLRGSAGNVYSIGWSALAANSPATSGSINALDIAITSQTAPIYIYQVQPGSAYLRQYQGRPLSVSATLQLVSGSALCRFNYVEFFDPTQRVFEGKAFSFQEGRVEYSDILQVPFIGAQTIGASPHASIEFEIMSSPGCVFILEYVKAELSESPTVLYVDHALERTRINNSP